MIEDALVFITDQLNQYLRNQLALSQDKVYLSSLTNQQGEIAVSEQNVLIFSLLRAQEETVLKSGPWTYVKGDQSMRSNPAVHMNLYVMFAAYFDDKNYREALKFLSAVVSYFQGHLVFEHQNYPSMPSSIERLQFEIYHSDFHEINYIWGMTGAKFMPSMMYKIRMITFDQAPTSSVQPVTSSANPNIGS
ncbi:MAG: DUF4255 domain-containing protein [Salibacteraceae bacterium]